MQSKVIMLFKAKEILRREDSHSCKINLCDPNLCVVKKQKPAGRLHLIRVICNHQHLHLINDPEYHSLLWLSFDRIKSFFS